MLIIFDGPRHMRNEPTLSFGARGISTITLTVYGPVFPQHSGHYGNYCPNPAFRLSQLIASMKDEYGIVTIPGYYDGISIDNETLEILKAVPDDERVIKARLGIAGTDHVAPNYQESLQYPSLNVRGMSSGWVGSEVRTIIPSSAVAEIDIRLVKEVDPDRLISLVRKHIEDQGYFLVSDKPTQQERAKYDRICRFRSSTSYLAFRTDFDSDVGVWLTSALINTFGSTPIRHRTAGGSIPISPFVTTLDIPAVAIPTVNRDNNQHSPNENLRLGNYVDGIKTMIGILIEPLGVEE
jgi:acetylornithine deacetylase/succinyl-diaminopimelate desuccinylase-like protein